MKKLLAGLFRSTPAAPPADPATLTALLGSADLEVTGENYYPEAIGKAMTARSAPRGGVRNVTLELVREPGNAHDRHAVAVHLDGKKVGHVPAETARRLSPAMAKAGYGKKPLPVPGRIWARRDGSDWFGRVTVSPSGETEEQWNYVERLGADRNLPAGVGERLTDQGRLAQYAEAERAGLVAGRPLKEHQPTVVEHRLAGRWEPGIALAMACRDAAERVAAVYGMRPEAWPTEELARLHRGMGDAAGEVAVLEHYVASCGDQAPATALAKRLVVARSRRDNPAAAKSAQQPSARSAAGPLEPSPYITEAVLQDLDRATADRARGMTRGKHYTQWVEPVQQLKRDGEHEKALSLLLECIPAALQDTGPGGAAPWYTEQAGIVLRKLGDLDGEIKLLEYHLDRDPTPAPKLRERLAKARAKAGR